MALPPEQPETVAQQREGLLSLRVLWRFELHKPMVVAAAGVAGLVITHGCSNSR